MEIKTLRYFLAVAREENMTHAAELLHVTQPTLSKALRALEEELGKKLFTRHSFSIALTMEGRLLRDRAEHLISMADKIEEEFLTLDDITGGDIYFGLAESYQIQLLAQEVKKLKMRYPNFTYHITSGDTEQVTEKMDKGLLDFAVLTEIPETRKYHYLEFPVSDTWGVVVPQDHPLSRKKAIRVDDLVGQPLFTSEQGFGFVLSEWVKERAEELHLEGSFRLSYNAAMFVKAGLGIMLTFEHIIDCSRESGLVFRPLYPALRNKLYLVWSKYQTFTPLAEKFLEQVKESFLSKD